MEEEALNTSIEETNPPEKFVDGGAREKQDYFETRINQPGVSTENLFHLHGAESFNNFKSKDDYWDNEAIQNKFVEAFGTDARYKFDEAYDNSKQEFSNFKMGKFQSSKSGYELIRDDLSDLRSTVRLRHTNMAGTVMMGTEWSNPTKDYRENFNKVRVKSLDDEGNEVYTIKDYSPELLEELEEDDSFGGLAYSDSFYNIDPNEGVDGLYYEAIYDGKIHDALSDSVLDVRNDQIVSRWDIDTGTGMFDDIFKNNKLEADGVLDYAKLLVKAPMNMAFNMMDTAIQLGRAATAGTNALFNMVREEDLALDSNSFYKMLTTAGIKMKGHNTSLSREALEDGFFGSMEAFLSTTADIALQVALAGGLGRAGAGLSGIMTKGMAPKAIQQAEKRAAEVFVRGTLTSMAAKDSYNEALENGFTTTEASLITGGMVVALWKATKYAGYLFGEYEAKLLRENVKKVVSNEQKTFLQRTFKKITEGNLKKGLPADTGKGLAAFASGDNAVTRVFGKIVKGLPSKKWVYAARQEGLEEMTEELFQDGVKHAASAYGVLINNAKEARKGRYLSIFDEGYFIDAAERYATSGLAGAMGGPMGIAMTGKVDVSTISSTSTLADIILSGNKSELVSVLKEMKTNGELGPDSLSTEYNIDLDAFEPLVEKSGAESLSDMVYNTYLHDINVVDTFINTGMMAQAKTKLELDDSLKEFVDTNAMRKDLASLMGNLLDFHTNKGVSISIYTDLDKLNDVELAERIPEIIEEFKGKVDKQREELKELKEKLKAKTPTVDEDEDGTDENPKVKKKEKVKSAIDGKADKIARLEAEIELSKNVTKGDLKQMLSDYRKVRAIATGAASEYYLLQNEFADDAVLGAMYKRKKEHEILGDHPFRDMLFSMRIRSIKDEKNHLLKIKKSEDSEARILAYKTLEEGDMDDLLAYVKKNGSTLSEKALKHIVKLRDKLDFTEANEAFNIKNDDSIFDRDADGKVIEKDMNQLFLEVLAADPFNKDKIGRAHV